MRTILIAILLFLDLVLFGQGYNYMAPSIPSGGLVQTIDSLTSPNNVFVGTGNTTVNLGSNSYSIQYNGTPAAGTSFICRFDATQLTANPNNVSIFGLTPLKEFPGQGVYYIRYQVSGTRVNNKTVFVSYAGSMILPGGNVNVPTKFNNEVTFYDSVHLHINGQIPTGAGVIALNDSGTLGYGCTPWCTSGNAGLNRANFLGSTDTASLKFGVNGLPAGIVSYNLANTAIGLDALYQNTSGANSVAIGAGALSNNTTGNNTAVGAFSSGGITTGSGNTAIGRSSFASFPTTGSNNTAIGGNATVASAGITGATVVGYNTTASNYGVSIGFGAVAGTNECQIAGVQRLTFPGMNSAPGYVLTDSAGAYVPRPAVFTTPLIDTVTGTSSQTFTLSNNQTNILAASTTVAGATLAFPAVQSGTIIVIWKVSTTTTTVSGTNTGTCSIPSTVAAGVSRTFICTNGNWY